MGLSMPLGMHSFTLPQTSKPHVPWFSSLDELGNAFGILQSILIDQGNRPGHGILQQTTYSATAPHAASATSALLLTIPETVGRDEWLNKEAIDRLHAVLRDGGAARVGHTIRQGCVPAQHTPCWPAPQEPLVASLCLLSTRAPK